MEGEASLYEESILKKKYYDCVNIKFVFTLDQYGKKNKMSRMVVFRPKRRYNLQNK